MTPNKKTIQKKSQPKISDPPVKAAREILEGFLNLADSATCIPPSHYHHSDLLAGPSVFHHTTFLYDLAIFMMALNQAGFRRQHWTIVEFVLKAYELRLGMTVEYQGVFGFRNAFNRSNGEGILEWWITPGPMAFMIFALLDSYGSLKDKKLLELALCFGEVLLKMQREDGAVIDGSRGPDQQQTSDAVYAEPHLDACAAFGRLFELTEGRKWLTAAEKAHQYFTGHLLQPSCGLIHQGIIGQSAQTIHATDVYAWAFLGPFLKWVDSEDLISLMEYNLKKTLVRVKVSLPDGRSVDVCGADFTDPADDAIIAARSGFHPMVSIEWTAGVISSLYSSAIRLWKVYEVTGKSGYRQKSQEFTAIGDELLAGLKKCFYKIPDISVGKIGFYASGQDAPIGHGWNTFHFNTPELKGGSLASVWAVFPLLGYNPFSGEYYLEELNRIRRQTSGNAGANAIRKYTDGRFFEEVNGSA